MTNRILVTGGAGYIGSHTVHALLGRGYHVVILDNFSTGHRAFTQGCQVIECDLRDGQSLAKVFEANEFDAVMHFAAKSIVSESVQDPLEYFENNVTGSINLIQCAIRHEIKSFVFSSTAAVYGNPITEMIDERHPINPINPYGQSKAIVETILIEAARAYTLNSVSFRYFNAAGAAPELNLGENHNPETHLIPNILTSCLKEPGAKLKVFGADYDTPDGSCVRDYVHVKDLAKAHLLGLEYISGNRGCHQLNLGTREGSSVFEVIKTCEEVAHRPIAFEIVSKRAGDPATLVADYSRAQAILDWIPENSLNNCINDAWLWHQSQQGQGQFT